MYSVEKVEQLTLFPPGTHEHASLLVLPGSEKARKTTVTSGRKCFALYKPYSLGGLLVRMLLGTSHWDSTLCYLTWTVSDTPGKRLLFRLAASTPHIEEREFSLWATPNTMDYLPQRSEESLIRQATTSRKGRTKPANLREQVDENTVRLWLTPTTREWKGARTPEALKAAGRNATNSLSDAVRAQETGQLNPEWVEWLMGFPIGYTDLKHSEMQLSPSKSIPS